MADQFPKNENQLRHEVTRKRALLWCLTLGFLGAHRFYRGQKGLGYLYLAFFWTLIPLFASLIDAAELVIQDDEDFREELIEDPAFSHAH